MHAKKQTTAKARSPEVTSHDWLAPVSKEAPCGADLEYDPEFVVMSAKSTAQPDAQYGNFVGSADPINWGDIDRDCRRLMLRTKDIRIVVLFIRCRTRLAGAEGFSEGMQLLASLLETYPDTVHPQLAVDSDRDAALEIRANALQALIDSDGLLSDLREVAFGKTSIARLQVRDVERAFARPRPVDALSQDSVTQQLTALRERDPDSLLGFDRAMFNFTAIAVWSELHLEAFAPDLSALSKLLEPLAQSLDSQSFESDSEAGAASDDVTVADAPEIQNEVVAPNEPFAAAAEPVGAAPVARTARAPMTGRQAALDHIREARAWFEAHEPSSPIPVLLKRAEHFVGARYAQIVQAIPPELLARWESDD